MYRVLRWLPHALLASHLLFKLITQERSVFLDLILYNVIWIAAVIAIAQSPLSNDPIAVASACLAITFWGVGSLLNSYGEFYQLPTSAQLFAQASYALFYPCALVAIPRSLVRGRRLNPLELLDSAIFGLGISSIATALFLSRVFPQSLINLQDQFFSLLYPVCDLLLLVIASVALVTHRLQARAALLFLGIAICKINSSHFSIQYVICCFWSLLRLHLSRIDFRHGRRCYFLVSRFSPHQICSFSGSLSVTTIDLDS